MTPIKKKKLGRKENKRNVERWKEILGNDQRIVRNRSRKRGRGTCIWRKWRKNEIMNVKTEFRDSWKVNV